MGFLHISLLGSVRVARDESQTEVKLTHSTQALLAYLVLFRRRTHPRETLAGLFWGQKNPERARSSLSTALWQLRQAVEPETASRGTYLIGDHTDEIGFNPDSPFWLDVQAFEDEAGPAARARCDTPLPKLDYALALYRGDLMEGFYDDWVLRERERFRERYLATLMCQMEIHRRQGDYGCSLACGQKILELDPLREDIHRYLMDVYMLSGQRALAARQYEHCRDVLARELQIAPMPETQALYQHVLSPSPAAAPPGQPPTEAANDQLQQALWQLRQAQATIETAQHQLSHSIQAVESALKQQPR